MHDQRPQEILNAFAPFNIPVPQRVTYEPDLEPDHRRAEQFALECEDAEREVLAILEAHCNSPLQHGDALPTECSEAGCVKLSVQLTLEVDPKHPQRAADALRLLASGLEAL